MSCPKLRFKRDDGTDFPEWQEVTIGEYCDILDRKRKPITKKNRVAGTYPYYGATNIQGYVNDYIFDEPLVLLGEDSAPFMDFKNKAIAQLATGKYWVNNHAHCLRPHGNVAFLYYSLVHKDIREYVNNPKRPKLNQGDMVRIPISIPCLEEQEKIANFLLSIDEVISLSEAEVQNLKDQKKAVMQKIFSRKAQFKREDGTEFPEWKQQQLSELCSITTGKLNANAMVKNGKYMFFTCAHETYRINEYAFDGEAILISGNGDVGHSKYYNGKFNAYQRTYVLMNFHDNPLYIKAAIDRYLPKKISEELNGSAMPYITLETLTSAWLPIPCLEEQQKIADISSAYDEAISCAEQELDKWKELKMALLRQMFV